MYDRREPELKLVAAALKTYDDQREQRELCNFVLKILDLDPSEVRQMTFNQLVEDMRMFLYPDVVFADENTISLDQLSEELEAIWSSSARPSDEESGDS